MNARRGMGLLVCTAAALLANVGWVAPAAATDDQVTEAEAAAAAIVDTEIVSESPGAPVVRSGDGFISTQRGVVTDIPVDPSDAISVATVGGARLLVGLPGGRNADDAVLLDGNAAVYADALPDTTVAAQALSGGGVRALIVIQGADAPEQYRFPLDVPPGYGLEQQADGSVEVYDTTGNTQFSIAPPWATDANGDAVETSYRIEGTTLVQTIRHSGAAYPVVADPAVENNCGIVSCKLYFNRSWTRNMRDGAWIVSASASLCGFTGPAAPLCAAAIAVQATAIAVFAGRYYEDGDCVKLKYSPLTGLAFVPERHRKGERNCK